MSFITKLAGLFGGKNPIDSLADVADRFIQTKEEKAAFKIEFMKLKHEIETAADRLELENVQGARDREAKVKAAGAKDILMTITGVVALGSGLFVLVWAFVGPDMTQLQERIFYFVAGASFGWVGSVVNYFFGSSKSSQDKSKQLNNIIENK